MSYTRNLFFDDLGVLDEKGMSISGSCFDTSLYMYIKVLENQNDYVALMEDERNILHDGCVTSLELIYSSNMQSNPIKIGRKYAITCHGENKSISTSFDVVFLQTERTKKIDSRTNQYFLSGVKITSAYDMLGIFTSNKIHHILEYSSKNNQMKIHKLANKEDFADFQKQCGSESAIYELNDWLKSQDTNVAHLPIIRLEELQNYFI